MKINPCNSPHHPAVVQGGLGYAKDEQQTSVQEAYTPLSACYGCGPAASGGLGLRSFRSGDGGLGAQIGERSSATLRPCRRVGPSRP